ncbi:MAG TPA: bifunctional precorrin-2 dehydrogenase/sirohydrochlorin ferrochelatase [Candidatus Binataceae bacterium]
MGYLPIFLDVSGQRCMVIGGGEIAARKVASLLEAGAVVTVISPTLVPTLESSAARGAITHEARAYRLGDMKGFLIVFATTDDRDLQRALAAEARELGILINIADASELCTFIAPAVVSRGALRIAISTSGASPALASRIRRELEHQFGAEYARALDILRAARHHLRGSEPRIETRADKLRALADSALPDHLRRADFGAVDRILREHLGVGLEALGLKTAELRTSGAAH